jgi:3-oxoacyl-(acyl-carrier-protein) synthase
MGAVTPLAADVEASWSRLLAGRSGIRRLPDRVVGDPAGEESARLVPSLEEDPTLASIRIPSLRGNPTDCRRETAEEQTGRWRR